MLKKKKHFCQKNPKICYTTIMTNIQKNKGLLNAFREYKKRYLNLGKKPNLIRFLPEAIYRTMKLEGEKITRKQVQALFK